MILKVASACLLYIVFVIFFVFFVFFVNWLFVVILMVFLVFLCFWFVCVLFPWFYFCGLFQRTRVRKAQVRGYCFGRCDRLFRRKKDSYIADIRTLEQSCKDVMRLMLESIQKYDKIKAEIREARNELESCADNLVFDLVDLN